MPNYYEILKLPPGASAAEVEAAIEGQANQWQRLVTHPDPNVVAQANLALKQLDMIHSTLTDAKKRKLYDAGIGLSSPGGPADPQPAAGPTLVFPTPPPPRAAPPQVAGPVKARVGAWVCPNCQTPNPAGTLFCGHCGTALGRECPRCTRLVEASAQFCPHCGVNIPEFLRAHERLDQQAQELARQPQPLEAQAPHQAVALEPLKNWANQAIIGGVLAWLVFCAGLSLGLLLLLVPLPAGWAIYRAVGVLRSTRATGAAQAGSASQAVGAAQAVGASTLRKYAAVALGLAGTALAAVACVGLLMLISISNY